MVQSCAEVGQDVDVVAEVYGKQLTRESLNYMFDGQESIEDSIEIASRFIDKWTQEEVLVYFAKQNLLSS